MDEQRFRVAFTLVYRPSLATIGAVKKSWIKGNIAVERSVFAAGRRPNCGKQAISDTGLRIGTKGNRAGGIKLPDRGQQPHHPFLYQVFTVAAHQKKRAGTSTHQAAITKNKCFFRRPVTAFGSLREVRIRKFRIECCDLFFHRFTPQTNISDFPKLSSLFMQKAKIFTHLHVQFHQFSLYCAKVRHNSKLCWPRYGICRWSYAF